MRVKKNENRKFIETYKFKQNKKFEPKVKVRENSDI